MFPVCDISFSSEMFLSDLIPSILTSVFVCYHVILFGGGESTLSRSSCAGSEYHVHLTLGGRGGGEGVGSWTHQHVKQGTMVGIAL